MSKHVNLALPLFAALALAACGQEQETTYEADATDLGGGELIVTEEDPDAVPVDTPDTPMTNVPDDTATDTAE
ncbi:MAG: hypothetical protein KJO02_04260 [Erythrobacter sp.]|nr:hypothetical protein [Erythrobacter sp.]NNC51737.1 hypothetical protein [Erythrobacter sp.]